MRPSGTTLLLLAVLAVAAAAISPSSPTVHGLPPPPPWLHRVANSTGGTVGCFPHERDALLAFKRLITSDPASLLASWQPGGQHDDCCRWGGVRCSNRTGHVVGLHLQNTHVDPIVVNAYQEFAMVGKVSPSLLSLQHLEYLDISLNKLQGPTGRVPVFLGSLRNLRYLNLSGIPFSGRVPPQLGNLTKLHFLDLSIPDYVGDVPGLYSTDISPLTHQPLRCLKLSYVNLSAVADWAHQLNMIPSLRVLDLSGCDLTSANQSLPHLNLTNLEDLNLSGNHFSHPVAACWFWNLTNLRYLRVRLTYLHGPFPAALGRMTSLQVLDFSISDPIDIMTATMRNLCNLEILDLSYSDMHGTITELFERLPQCSPNKLKELHLDNNNFTGVLPNWIGQWTTLLILDVSVNQLTGPVPSEIGILNSLAGLYLDDNDLSGVITHEHLAGLKSLTEIDLSRNCLKIVLDPKWLPPFTLQYASFAACEMGPKFPAWLQSQVNLDFLDISSAAIFDNLPNWFCTILSNTWKLNISNNGINGTLPTNMEVMTSLRRLHLNSNQLTGQIPRSWPKGLDVLDISRNKLSGPLPSNFVAPGDLRLFSNHLTGHYVPVINLSVGTKGHERYYEESQIFHMVIVDLSSNFLTGVIPEEITSLVGVISLNLSRNHLSGRIPDKIGAMQSLESLDLSENKLDGEIPQGISNLTYLENLDLSYNNLTGRIPSGGQLDTLYSQNPSMYDGNIGLCGYPLKKNCSDGTEPKHGDDKGDEHDTKLMSFPFGLGIGYMAGLWVVFSVMLFKKSWRVAYFRLFDKIYDKVYVFVAVTWARWAPQNSTQ